MIDPKKIWSSSQLPTLPAVAVRLLELTRNPETEMRAVVELIKSDPAISVKILKACNSTFFGFSSKVTTIDRAVPLLGTSVVASLALSFSLVDSARGSGPAARFFSQFWLRSIVQASCAESIGRLRNSAQASEFFLSGLLMDLGRLAMLKTITAQFIPVLERSESEQRPINDLTREMLGIDPVQIGSELMKNFCLAESLRTAAALAEEPLEVLQSHAADPEFPLIQSLAIAAAAGEYFCGHCKGLALNRLRELTASFYQFDEARLDKWLEDLRQRVDSSAELLSIKADDLDDPSELMSQANEQLVQLAMRASMESQTAIAKQQAMEQERQRLESLNQELQRQALHDPLTKVYNRNFFDEALRKETARCARYADALGIIFIDVDHFKKLNDTYGHKFGDEVLQKVAKAVGEVLRNADTLARYGGEEFVIIASQPTEKGLARMAERIRERIQSEKLSCNGTSVTVTASVGAAMCVPARNEENKGPELVHAADQAMYEAKQGGRNQVRVKILLDEKERELLNAVIQRRFSRWAVQKGYVEMAAASKALLTCPTHSTRLGELAMQFQLIDELQIDQVMTRQQKTGERFGDIAVQLGFLSREELVELLAIQQESPKQFVTSLVQLGFLDPRKAVDLLKEHRAAGALADLAVAQ